MRNYKIDYFLIVILLILIVKTTYPNYVYHIHIVQSEPIGTPILVDAGINEEIRNEIVWMKSGIVEPKYYKIYRSDIKLAEGWKEIGVVNSEDKPQFVDYLSTPLNEAYAYSITAIDECGNETMINVIFKSVALDGRKMNNNTYYLSWNRLQGLIVSGYNIYSGINPDSLSLIATTPSDVLTFIDSPSCPDQTYYQIEAIKNEEIISDTLIRLKNLSNIISTNAINLKTDSMNKIGLIVYPNPFNDEINIQIPNPEQLPYQISLYDIFGRKVREQYTSFDFVKLSRINLNNGIYLLYVKGIKNYTTKLVIY
jgi:hypothetical protein